MKRSTAFTVFAAASMAVCLVWLAGPRLVSAQQQAVGVLAETVAIPAGQVRPLYTASDADPVGRARAGADAQVIQVAAFEMDRYPVTNAAFLRFTQQHPGWKRGAAAKLFADERYLLHWQGEGRLGPAAKEHSPVVNVSWFAAKAYCEARGMTLPTVAQWEYVAAAGKTVRDASGDTAHLQQVAQWYSEPLPEVLPDVRRGFENAFGVSGMHQAIWEWTLDFNSAMITGDSRRDSALDRQLFCGSSSIGASDFRNYAAFLRYGMRSSIGGNYTAKSLGFRCAQNIASGTH